MDYKNIFLSLLIAIGLSYNPAAQAMHQGLPYEQVPQIALFAAMGNVQGLQQQLNFFDTAGEPFDLNQIYRFAGLHGTLLHFACCNSHTAVVKLLLNKGANIEAQNDEHWTPLHLACQNGQTDVVKLLLNNRANIEAQDNEHWTPLHFACHDGHAKVAKLLLNNHANIDAQDNEHWTPLHLACQEGYAKVVKLLLSNGANIEAQDNIQWTSLLLACQEGHAEVVKLLLDNGANIENQTNELRTPLHIACQGGHAKVVNLLLNNGANIKAEAMQKITTLHPACFNGHVDVVLVLLKHQACFTAITEDGRTPVTVARQQNHHALANFIEAFLAGECAIAYTDEPCSICMETFEEDALGIQLSCNHFFHHDCLKEWTKESPTCPLDRRETIVDVEEKTLCKKYVIIKKPTIAEPAQKSYRGLL